MRLIPSPQIDAGNTPRGKANWIEIVSGEVTTVDGRHIANILSGGGDYMARHVDEGVLEVDLRVMAQDPSGALFRFTATGYDYVDKRVMGLMDGVTVQDTNSSNAPLDAWGVEIFKCNTSSVEFGWMNYAVLLAKVEFTFGATGIDHVDFTVYKVTR